MAARVAPSDIQTSEDGAITKNRNTHAKRMREMDKKAKQEAKRSRRNNRKQGGDETDSEPALDAEGNPIVAAEIDADGAEANASEDSKVTDPPQTTDSN